MKKSRKELVEKVSEMIYNEVMDSMSMNNYAEVIERCKAVSKDVVKYVRNRHKKITKNAQAKKLMK